eukprot:CAMPEP_0194572470 /NCGR_PEP_ID=MMETSP0292-20121207/9038_1 /TAXON_ID=39354 /ORGANISM="Heterosigma akashiwo, Strain CCMP2393" /LENGTH=149 /DNA_ID=CAMNT_0039423457 /DNA_START=61 /DNA_END=512 /DNA_ORIENTATION=+
MVVIIAQQEAQIMVFFIPPPADHLAQEIITNHQFVFASTYSPSKAFHQRGCTSAIGLSAILGMSRQRPPPLDGDHPVAAAAAAAAAKLVPAAAAVVGHDAVVPPVVVVQVGAHGCASTLRRPRGVEARGGDVQHEDQRAVPQAVRLPHQ